MSGSYMIRPESKGNHHNLQHIVSLFFKKKTNSPSICLLEYSCRASSAVHHGRIEDAHIASSFCIQHVPILRRWHMAVDWPQPRVPTSPSGWFLLEQTCHIIASTIMPVRGSLKQCKNELTKKQWHAWRGMGDSATSANMPLFFFDETTIDCPKRKEIKRASNFVGPHLTSFSTTSHLCSQPFGKSRRLDVPFLCVALVG